MMPPPEQCNSPSSTRAFSRGEKQDFIHPFNAEASRVCHSFTWVRLSPPTILQEECREKLLMLRQAANAWENMTKTQPAANANTIISPRQIILCGKNNSHQNVVKFFIIYEVKPISGLLFHACSRVMIPRNPLF